MVIFNSKDNNKCVNCDKVFSSRHQTKYCSNACQGQEKHHKFLKLWKEGKINGSVGIKTRIISSTLRRYIFNKYDNKCSICGWNKENPSSGKLPLEIDHIDGNSENNTEDNLRLLCPNCHSLTPHFRNLNKGNGRSWRIKNTSR